ncbi:MAG: ATP synthase F0 subunit B [Desulfobacterales bacterium]|nr:ATP synthase F0 subunit B [Desulfobacterales bacterium]
MEIVENLALISLNETLIAQLIAFLIFFFLINRIMIRPLRETMGKRQDYIKNTESEILQSSEKLEDLNQQLLAHERKVVREANSEKEDLKNQGNQQAQEILGESKNEIDQIREENTRLLNQEIAEARKYIDAESEKLAGTIMETILERGVSRG